MTKRKSREELLGWLERIAFYRPNDAIRIAMEAGEVDMRRMKLEGVSEFKRHANGSVEVKFFDRLKALELLLELSEQQEDGGSLQAFFREIAGGKEE